MSLSRNHKIVIAVVAVVTVFLIIIGISSCTPRKTTSAGQGGYSSTATASCVPPLACGPHYSGYIPPYYLAHPSYALFSPYRAFYTPSFNGRSYSVARTPAGRAPVAARTPLPYPPGYKPVPGDFQPPTAKPVPAAPQPAPSAPRSSVKAPEPAKKQVDPPKVTTPKQAPKAPARTKSGGR